MDIQAEPPDLQLDKARGAARLSAAARRLHLAVLAGFAETGRPISRAELERTARDHGRDPAAVIAELVGADLVLFDDGGEIRAAYPFSPVPTRHRITWAEGPTVYAMCAIDALGMSAMLGRAVTITATEPGTGEPITVTVDGGRASWTPDTSVVFCGADDPACCSTSADRTCGYINFFTTAEAARDWAERHPAITGTVIDQRQALAGGIAEFGDLMKEHRP